VPLKKVARLNRPAPPLSTKHLFLGRGNRPFVPSENQLVVGEFTRRF